MGKPATEQGQVGIPLGNLLITATSQNPLGFAADPIKAASPLRLKREAIAAGWRGIRPTLSVTCRLGDGIGNTIALLVEQHKFNPSPLCWFSGKAEDESALSRQFSCASLPVSY